MASKVKIIGGGLAGSEAAWQLAERGFQVELYEMRSEQRGTIASFGSGTGSAGRSGGESRASLHAKAAWQPEQTSRAQSRHRPRCNERWTRRWSCDPPQPRSCIAGHVRFPKPDSERKRASARDRRDQNLRLKMLRTLCSSSLIQVGDAAVIRETTGIVVHGVVDSCGIRRRDRSRTHTGEQAIGSAPHAIVEFRVPLEKGRQLRLGTCRHGRSAICRTAASTSTPASNISS